MCEAYVKCEPNVGRQNSASGYVLYYFQTKTFWGQIATIWDYFAVWFDPVTSENRPATIYRFTDNAENMVSTPTTTYLSVADSRIDIDQTWIDRDTHAWNDNAGNVIGHCNRLGIPESMELVAQQSP